MKTREINAQKISSIKLPASFRKGKLFVLETQETMIIRKSPVFDFSYVREKLRKVKDKISQEDIEKAIQAARE